jgi:hypothetical protein
MAQLALPCPRAPHGPNKVFSSTLLAASVLNLLGIAMVILLLAVLGRRVADERFNQNLKQPLPYANLTTVNGTVNGMLVDHNASGVPIGSANTRANASACLVPASVADSENRYLLTQDVVMTVRGGGHFGLEKVLGLAARFGWEGWPPHLLTLLTPLPRAPAAGLCVLSAAAHDIPRAGALAGGSGAAATGLLNPGDDRRRFDTQACFLGTLHS